MFAPMGFTGPIAEFLVEARLGGADFTETLTLGHQSLFVSPRRLGRLLARNALWPPGLTLREFYAGFTESPGYVDSFLRGLGAQRVDSMDASPYERAGIIHDLNTPVPDELKESYTVILPGGTLEHVFNFPIALKSCMEMLRPGGRLFIYAVGNQQFGHGFYFLPVQPRSLLSRPLRRERLRVGADGCVRALPQHVRGCASAVPGAKMWPRHRISDPTRQGGRHGLYNRWELDL